MGLAIVIGAIVALAIGLLLWCRGAMAAADRRHKAQVETNARIAALTAKMHKERTSAEALERRQVIAKASARTGSMTSPSRSPATSRYDNDQSSAYSPPAYTAYDYGSASDSYSGGGSCSSDGGGGGCD